MVLDLPHPTPPKQMTNPKKMLKCFKKICPDLGNGRDLQLTAQCWHLRLLNTIQHLQEEENASGSDLTPATGPGATPAPEVS